MKLVFLVADAAQVDDRGKVHVIGLGWTNIPTVSPPLALVLIVDIEQHEAPNTVGVKVELLDKNDQLAKVVRGQDSVETIQIIAGGQAMPLPDDRAGEPNRLPLVIQLDRGIRIVPGTYKFRATVNIGAVASETVDQVFRVLPEP